MITAVIITGFIVIAAEMSVSEIEGGHPFWS
jgi:hypothetical protein